MNPIDPETTRSPLARACLLALAAASLLASPATAENLTLAEAMARGRAKAREVAAAELREDASRSRLRQAKGARLPTVQVEETWIRTDSPADSFGLLLNQERFSFPAFLASDPNDPDPLSTATTRLQVSLPLYTGGEIAGRIGQAREGEKAASAQRGWVADGAALAAAEAYVRLAQAREQVALLERSLATVEAHVALARSYVDQGMLVRSELLRAEVERARVQDLLTRARGQARVAESNLAFRLAADPDTRWELEPLPPPAPLAGDLDAWLTSTDSRGDLAAARHQVEAARLEERVARAALLPRVGLVVRHDLVDDRLFGTHGDSTTIVAQGSIELFAGGRNRAARAAARADAEAADQDVARAAEGARLQVRNAYEEATAARRRFTTARQALDAARETERITEARFRQGVVKTIDLLDAETARREAETRELVARADASLAGLVLAVQAGRPPESAAPVAAGGRP